MIAPIIYICYNRPKLTKISFGKIREIKPTTLLIIQDGAKNDIDKVKCNEVKEIIEKVDWQCDVMYNFSSMNLGCGKRVSTGINWAFQYVEYAIILEDDIIPTTNFIKVCSAMLEIHKHNMSIFQISGLNLLGKVPTEDKFYYSKLTLMPWGWATWKRSWEKYEFTIQEWETNKVNFLTHFTPENQQFINYIFELNNKHLSTWDLQWNYCVIINNGYSLIPSANMIKNIGFDSESTFTKKSFEEIENLGVYEFTPSESIDENLTLDIKLENIIIKLIHQILNNIEK